ncbi:MAG TPA: efflux RND transporter periplasmic adaptor subunit [Patescibacteria group bacterium]|nr:efflux RND transporter periplasmic adaptor subunit [Patescibacteria group bacterium]
MARKKPNLFNSVKSNLFRTISLIFQRVRSAKLKDRYKSLVSQANKTIEKKPFTVFFTLLGVILLLIIVGSIIRKPKAAEKITPPIKTVEVYRIGTAPRIHVQAQVEKSQVAKIEALSGGVVSQINVVEGQTVEQGTPLVSLASNYSGGNMASLQRQLAQNQYQNVQDTYDAQKDIIQKQRQAADENRTNEDKMRDIANVSVTDTQVLVNLDNDILSTLNTNLQNLENTNTGGVNDQMILSTKEQISQFQAAIAQADATLHQTGYQADQANPPYQLATITHDETIEQLNIQEKTLDLSLEASKINLSIAQVAEAAMYPVAPFAGVVERIYVTAGQNVTSGTPLVLIHGAGDFKIVAKLPAKTAKTVSKLETSQIHITDKKTISENPSYISNEATDGSLYAVIFTMDAAYQNDLSDQGFVDVDIPVGYANTSEISPFIPLDSVYQTQNNSYVFVNDHGHAKSKNVTLGTVFGQYVEVEHGLSRGDEIVVSRNVLNGDPLKTE